MCSFFFVEGGDRDVTIGMSNGDCNGVQMQSIRNGQNGVDTHGPAAVYVAQNTIEGGVADSMQSEGEFE